MPSRNSLHQTIPDFGTIPEIGRVLLDVLKSIEGLTIQSVGNLHHLPVSKTPSVGFVVSAERNTWSRAARRKRLAIEHTSHMDVVETQKPELICCLQIQEVAEIPGNTQRKSTAGKALLVDWVRGVDRNMYESFVSHLGSKLGMTLKSKDEEMTM